MRRKGLVSKKIYSINLIEEYGELLRGRYANVSEVINELVEKHLEEIGLITPKPMETQSPSKEKIDLEIQALEKKLEEQHYFNRELSNAISFRFKKSKKTKQTKLERIELFEKALRNTELAGQLRRDLNTYCKKRYA